MMTIGQVSELTGYSKRMIRFLEEEKLIQPKRMKSKRRYFTDDELKKILEIRRFKELGFSYVEIARLLLLKKEDIVEHGMKLLKKHHQASRDLFEKIQRLEVLCYGGVRHLRKTEQTCLPRRVAYKIPMLADIDDELKKRLGFTSEITFLKFSDFFKENDIDFLSQFYMAEIFRQSSYLAILKGEERLRQFSDAWAQYKMRLEPSPLGYFSNSDLSEFFSNSEIILEQKLFDQDGQLVFHALLPYQAVFIAAQK